jgi:hypothetical protein
LCSREHTLEMWINGGEHKHTWDVNQRWRTHACLRCESMVENTNTLEMWINGGEYNMSCCLCQITKE